MSDGPETYTKMYSADEIPLRDNVDPEMPVRDQDRSFKVYCWDFRHYEFHLPYTEQLPAGFGLRDVIALYYGMTTWVDDTVGRLLGALEAAGLADNTIVVFTSDHGDNLGSHQLVQKGHFTEESIRIPLLVRCPGGGQRVIREQVGTLVDMMPTLLSLAELPCPDHAQGIDLSAPVRGVDAATERRYGIVETSRGAAIRDLDYLYGVPYAEGRTLASEPVQVFDMLADPYQMDNLSGRTRKGGRASELDGALRAWDARTPWMD
jgi:choline-sulfatase